MNQAWGDVAARRTGRLRIALLHNLKAHISVAPGAPTDALAEYDSQETADALAEALAGLGHVVIQLEADETLLDSARHIRPDICFNIAEGLRGDARESHVPALLEMLAIPYTGSKVLAHALSLDKPAAKQIWRDAGLPTAPFQVFRYGDETLEPALAFPLFVKPAREGSGMGISIDSVVDDDRQLRQQVRWVIETYRQPAIVETYLPGREFTVGVLGNALPPGRTRRSLLYDKRGYHVFPVLEIDLSPVAEAGGVYTGYVKSERPLAPNYVCPAAIDDRLASELKQLAIRAFEAIGALDVARVDFRLGADGQPYLIEINTLPGLNPTYSDIVLAARGEKISYQTLIWEILALALERYGMLQPAVERV